jgi:hypothetical protein
MPPRSTPTALQPHTQGISSATVQPAGSGRTPTKHKVVAARHRPSSTSTPLLDRPVPEIARTIALETARAPEIPLAILVVVALFLLVQHRIDGRDPKLAPTTRGDDPELTFGPPATWHTTEPG